MYRAVVIWIIYCFTADRIYPTNGGYTI